MAVINIVRSIDGHDSDGTAEIALTVKANSLIDEKKSNKTRLKRDVHGWIVLDKPVGMTSTHAVAVIKRLFTAKRVGHAGTLDPLASGCLPIALGEATKTVPFVVDGRKAYLFTVRWGEERDTDDAEGRIASTSDSRPDRAAIEALLPRFVGTIEQVPPRFSAIKIDGERAYDLAREGRSDRNRTARGNHPPARTGRYRRTRITRCSPQNAAKEPTYGRLRGILAGHWACSVMFARCAGAGSARSPKTT